MIVSSDSSLGHRTRRGCTDIRESRCLSVVGKCRRQSSLLRSQTGLAIQADSQNSSSLDDGRSTHMNIPCSSTGITETSGGSYGLLHRIGCANRSLFTVALLVARNSSVQGCQSENTNKGQSRIFWNWTGIAKCRSFPLFRDSRLTSITSASKCTRTTGSTSRSIRRSELARFAVGRPLKRLATYCDRFASGESTFTGLVSSVKRCETSFAALPALTRWRGHSTQGTQERRAARSMSGLASLSRIALTVTTQLLSGTKRQCR